MNLFDFKRKVVIETEEDLIKRYIEYVNTGKVGVVISEKHVIMTRKEYNRICDSIRTKRRQ